MLKIVHAVGLLPSNQYCPGKSFNYFSNEPKIIILGAMTGDTDV